MIAAVPRIMNLTTLPVGFSDIELAHIDVMRDEVQRGDIRVFYEMQIPNIEGTIGQEGLYHSVLAVVALTFGEGTFGLRAFSLLINMVTIAILYTLGVRLFGRLAGLLTASLYAVMMWTILLSRLVLVETALPLIVGAILLSLARALPVYNRARAESQHTIDFATMGVLISLSLYLHQTSLFLVLMGMTFVGYILVLRRPISLRRLSYIGFAILMLIIVAMPYFISTLRLPELGANGRIVGDFGSITLSIVESTLGIFWQGDSNALHNVPQRPLMDVVSGLLVLLGLVLCIQRWRSARHALLIIAVIMLGPPVVLADNSPNFMAMTVVLPVIVLLFGLGASRIIQLVPKRVQTFSIALVISLLLFNLGWSYDSLFNTWSQLEEVHLGYNGDIGLVAQHLDITANDIPAIMCDPLWNRVRHTNEALTNTELIYLHMNRDTALLREVDCRHAFVFADAGTHQQVVLADPIQLGDLSPTVADWLSLGTSIETLPDGMVIDLQVRAEVEDALGVFLTTSPASLATATDISERFPIAPPIRFGGNITWLGYESDPFPEYLSGMTVPVTTYWRIEGLIPSDLLVFTHILSDPVFPAAQIDTIYANPRHLRERDVYLHDASVDLPIRIETGNYVISVGVYQGTSSERLPVFVNRSETQGNRIFLYSITIE